MDRQPEAKGDTLKLRKFQQEFRKNVIRPEIKTAALSIARGNGKSTLAGEFAADALTPNSEFFPPRH